MTDYFHRTKVRTDLSILRNAARYANISITIGTKIIGEVSGIAGNQIKVHSNSGMAQVTVGIDSLERVSPTEGD